MPPIIWIGLDVHKNSTTAAILEHDAADPQILRLGADLNQLRKLLRRLSERGTPRVCYEASGCGFVVHRVLENDGYTCEVIAPSLIPTRSGDRQKTDRRDAANLVPLYRSGLLTPVHVPDEEQEAVRDLVRTHVARTKQIKVTKLRIHGLLLRQGYVFRKASYWTRQHRAWLARLRRQLTGPAATILATEVDDVRRFASAPKFMAWTGLVPSESSSGDRQRHGPITKTGNIFLRHVLVEAAHNHRRRVGSTLILRRRRSGQPPEIVSIAVKAQHSRRAIGAWRPANTRISRSRR